MQKISTAILLTATSLQVGCASMIVPKPTDITLENAMTSVVKGLKAMQDEAQKTEGDRRYGLVPDDITVTFNITATGTQGAELHVEATPIAGLGAGGKAGGSAQTSEQAGRGNVITIHFKNILFAADNTLVAKRTPAQIGEIIRKNNQHGAIIPLGGKPSPRTSERR